MVAIYKFYCKNNNKEDKLCIKNKKIENKNTSTKLMSIK